ncbi:hypothetical protein KIPB_013724, partial [Kipferlia bialata]|eukprot:g13724.t1
MKASCFFSLLSSTAIGNAFLLSNLKMSSPEKPSPKAPEQVAKPEPNVAPQNDEEAPQEKIKLQLLDQTSGASIFFRVFP